MRVVALALTVAGFVVPQVIDVGSQERDRLASFENASVPLLAPTLPGFSLSSASTQAAPGGDELALTLAGKARGVEPGPTTLEATVVRAAAGVQPCSPVGQATVTYAWCERLDENRWFLGGYDELFIVMVHGDGAVMVRTYWRQVPMDQLREVGVRQATAAELAALR